MLAAVALAGLTACGAAGSPESDDGVQATDSRRGGKGVGLKRVGNFESPVYVAGAPGFRRLLFVVEQTGRVRVLRGGRKLGRPFLDIRGLVSTGGERGLLSIAFPPDYRESRRFYVYYTDRQGDIRIDEFRRKGATRAARGSRRAVVEIPHRANSNHNGGQLAFLGELLYFGTGDGGSGGDPPNNAQNRSSRLGKLLRIDPARRGAKPQIYSIGLRNPYRFSFDTVTAPRQPRIAIGDVGQNRFEEVDYEGPKTLRAANFGWDRWEGRKRYLDPADNEARTPKRKHHDRPIHVYSHGLDGHSCSITGGVVVNDPQLSNLLGRYLYADYCSGRLRSFVPALSGAGPPVALDDTFDSPTSFTSSPFDQRVYVTSLDGDVKRLEPLP